MATYYYDAINDGETQLASELDILETTSFTVNDGSQLPSGGALTSGFIVKLEDTLGNSEYIECSSRSGNTVTIANRGFEGSVARTWIAGSYLKNVWTKATKDEITDRILVATDTVAGTPPISIEDLETDINALEVDVSALEVDIGNLTYTEDNYVTDGEALTDSIDALDQALKDTDDNIGNLTYTEDNYVTDLESLTDSIDALDVGLFDVLGLLNSSIDIYIATASDDWNTMGIANGITMIYDDALASNGPTGARNLGLTINIAGVHKLQIVTRTNTSGDNLYFRRSSSGTWYPWRTISFT